MTRRLGRIVFFLAAAVAAAIAVLWLRSWEPADREAVAVDCRADTPAWTADRPLRVMSYNVQYMAGKDYVFFYDIDPRDEVRLAALTESGKELTDYPSREVVVRTLQQVADVILDADPDIVLLQEINGAGDGRTHFVDQVAELIERLSPERYGCHASTPYWLAEFIAHPNVLTAVDMRLLTLSKYRITDATRHQLPRVPRNALLRPFHFQRAILETAIARADGTPVAILNTHFDAWAEGSDVMRRQVAKAVGILDALDRAGTPWIFGGDLNLLPPDGGRQQRRLLASGGGTYAAESELGALYGHYRGTPSLEALRADDPHEWYTHLPNDPTVSAPDRTIDYLFFSAGWHAGDARIVHGDTWSISDHLPVLTTLSLAAEPAK